MYTLVFVILILMLIIPDIFFYFKLRNNKAKPILYYFTFNWSLVFYIHFHLYKIRDGKLA